MTGIYRILIRSTNANTLQRINVQTYGNQQFRKINFHFSVCLMSSRRQQRSVTKIPLKIICTSVAGLGLAPSCSFSSEIFKARWFWSSEYHRNLLLADDSEAVLDFHVWPCELMLYSLCLLLVWKLQILCLPHVLKSKQSWIESDYTKFILKSKVK